MLVLVDQGSAGDTIKEVTLHMYSAHQSEIKRPITRKEKVEMDRSEVTTEE